MLPQAIQQLYDVFARYQPGTLDKSCTCGCISPSDVDALRSKELRDLTAEGLMYYSFKAMTTFGTVHDYKYFLPRLCELIASASYPHNIEIVLAGKLEHAGFPDWSPDERAAVEKYLYALWDDLLHKWPNHNDAETVLCNITRVLGSPVRALDAWTALLPTQRSARRHLVEWVMWGPGNNDQPGPFWEVSRQVWTQVVGWQKTPAVAAVIESALREVAETPEGEDMFGSPERSPLVIADIVNRCKRGSQAGRIHRLIDNDIH